MSTRLLTLCALGLLGCNAAGSSVAIQVDSWLLSVAPSFLNGTGTVTVGSVQTEAGTLGRFYPDMAQDPARYTELPTGANWVHLLEDQSYLVAADAGRVFHVDAAGELLAERQLDTEAPLWGITGTGPDDFLAVGGTGRTGDAAVLAGPEGVRTLPAFATPRVHALYKVRRAGDLHYAVGQQGLLLRLSGERIEEIPSGVTQDLITVAVFDTTVVAVGGRQSGVLLYKLGEDPWRPLDLGGRAAGLNGVCLRSESEGVAVGVRGTVLRFQLSAVPEEAQAQVLDPVSALDLHAVDCFENGAFHAVGGNLAAENAARQGLWLSR